MPRSPGLIFPVLLILFLALPLPVRGQAQGQSSPLVGDWREPGGSVIRIAPCKDDLCARLVQLSAAAPTHLDAQNPDPSRRDQPLCNLLIGYGFHRTAPDHAEGGHLYDPKSGKTYQGELTVSGDHLNLRGYVGLRAFGRSEQWTRIPPINAACN